MYEEKVTFIVRKLKINCKHIFRNIVHIAGMLYSLVTIILAFASWEELGVLNFNCRILALLIILGISFLAGVIYTLMLQKHRNLWRCGGRSINVRYLDLIKLAFRKNRFGKNIGKKLIVIPVNTGFDTIVDYDPKQVDPLVSPNSLHGQWIQQMNRNRITVDELNRRIKKYLKENYPNDIKYISKTRGNGFRYP